VPLFFPAFSKGRSIVLAVLLYSFCAGLDFLLFHLPVGLAARGRLAGLGSGARIALAGVLGIPGFLFLLSRFESFDYGYSVLLQPATWAFLLPFLLGGTAVLAFLARSGEGDEHRGHLRVGQP
ncbi:MAG TPA: hypothetical protein VJ725_12485, partial [Thermoanaerobaculia bacterium]|nr:hypothetical protein [Thermoanaerobaculia bacterium]